MNKITPDNNIKFYFAFAVILIIIPLLLIGILLFLNNKLWTGNISVYNIYFLSEPNSVFISYSALIIITSIICYTVSIILLIKWVFGYNSIYLKKRCEMIINQQLYNNFNSNRKSNPVPKVIVNIHPRHPKRHLRR